jgi:hypothetical protein
VSWCCGKGQTLTIPGDEYVLASVSLASPNLPIWCLNFHVILLVLPTHEDDFATIANDSSSSGYDRFFSMHVFRFIHIWEGSGELAALIHRSYESRSVRCQGATSYVFFGRMVLYLPYTKQSFISINDILLSSQNLCLGYVFQHARTPCRSAITLARL